MEWTERGEPGPNTGGSANNHAMNDANRRSTLSVTGFRCVGRALQPWGHEVVQKGQDDRRRTIWTRLIAEAFERTVAQP